MPVVRKTKKLYADVRAVPVVFSGTGEPGRTAGSKKSIMVNDHVSDFITRIRNGYRARLNEVEMPATKLVVRVAEELSEAGYAGKTKVEKGTLTVEMKYKGKEPVITGIRRVSKPGARIYSGVGNLPKVLGGLGINILTTPLGVMSEKKAKKLKVGGEIICQVW